ILQVERPEGDPQLDRFRIQGERLFVSRDRAGIIARVVEPLGLKVLLERIRALVGARLLAVLSPETGCQSRFAVCQTQRQYNRQSKRCTSCSYIVSQSSFLSVRPSLHRSQPAHLYILTRKTVSHKPNGLSCALAVVAE